MAEAIPAPINPQPPAQKLPVYRRQRVLLHLLAAAGGKLDKLDFYKLLFLFQQERQRTDYAFVPYLYGAYSFLCERDLHTLEHQGWLVVENTQLRFQQSSKTLWDRATEGDGAIIRSWINKHSQRGDKLIKETYRRFPYYARNSEMKDRLMTKTELQQIDASVPAVDAKEIATFTIGYEGRHLEEYLNQLLKNRVRLLVDVRHYPLSRKFGFSSKNLSTNLKKMGIAYEHISALGVVSSKRKTLNSPAEYRALFEGYKRSLPDRQDALGQLHQLITTHKRVALTCFEADPQHCHRHCLTDWLHHEKGIGVKHL